jgi:hypothetical protein
LYLNYVKGRKCKLKDKRTALESIPLKTHQIEIDMEFRLQRNKFTTIIAWATSCVCFDKFIQQCVGRFQSILQEKFYKGYGEAIPATDS